MTDANYRDLVTIDKCARCGYDELKCSLHVHHIDKDRTNNDTSNLIVLCANCHAGLHNKLWALSDIGISVPDLKITPQEISELKYQNEKLRCDITTLNRQLKEANHNIRELEYKCEHCLLPKRNQFENNRMIALLSHFNNDERDFVEYFFHAVRIDLFKHVHMEHDKYTRILVDSIVEVYHALGYREWKNVHPDDINKMIEGKMCLLSNEQGIRENWVV